ncbi:hypothetical protein ACFL0V_04995 [Nanoarchaeota archaeon]
MKEQNQQTTEHERLDSLLSEAGYKKIEHQGNSILYAKKQKGTDRIDVVARDIANPRYRLFNTTYLQLDDAFDLETFKQGFKEACPQMGADRHILAGGYLGFAVGWASGLFDSCGSDLTPKKIGIALAISGLTGTVGTLIGHYSGRRKREYCANRTKSLFSPYHAAEGQDAIEILAQQAQEQE